MKLCLLCVQRERGGVVVGSLAVCVKKTEIGGKCVKGLCPCVLHTFAKASAGAWLTDERGVQG